jgi:hypothetical protein
LIFIAWTRVAAHALRSRSSLLGSKINSLDTLVILYSVFDALAYIALWSGSTDAIINRCGVLYTVLGVYFLFRSLIRNENDVLLAIKVLAYVSVIIAASMVFEQATGRNPFSFLGGERAWERISLMEREGAVRKIRAMASFQHPLTAGTFGGISLPLYVGLWLKRRKERVSAIVGIVSATIIVAASASSTPILAYLSGVLGLTFWPFRRQMRVVRRAIAVSLITLHLIMKAPVWALIQRIDIVGGSSSYHRYYLVDQFINRVGDWWLFGARSTTDWGPDMWDHANQYVAIGETSGIMSLILFIAIIVFAFKFVGRARKMVMPDRCSGLFFWAMGAALFANVIAFMGISYFDQVLLAWWSILAMISVATTPPSLTQSIPARSAGTMIAREIATYPRSREVRSHNLLRDLNPQ